VLFVGDDWAEAHHDIEIQDESGRRLVRRRLPEGIGGIAQLHELIGQHAGDGEDVDDPAGVVIGIETDRGPWVQALLAAGYRVFAINPLSVARYRERHVTSGAKSDPGDAKVLADLVRTDRQHHRPIAGDTKLAEAVKVLARAHQNVCWSPSTSWLMPMPWRFFRRRRPRRRVVGCLEPRSLPCCVGPGGSAMSRSAPSRSRTPSARRNWNSHR
jgi:hypothetical protein